MEIECCSQLNKRFSTEIKWPPCKKAAPRIEETGCSSKNPTALNISKVQTKML
jgi:hypothetical protein